VPYEVMVWRNAHPDAEIPDGWVFTQPWPPGPNDPRREQVIYYQYKADRARCTLRGIDEQIAKAESAVAGKAPVKRNRFLTITGGAKSINWAAGGQGPRAGRAQGLHHQHRQPVAAVRHRCLPPALAHREVVSDVQNTTCSPGRSTTTSGSSSTRT
jgi:hypothetical protein